MYGRLGLHSENHLHMSLANEGVPAYQSDYLNPHDPDPGDSRAGYLVSMH